MRKEEIQKLRENVVRGIAPGIERKHLPVPKSDARLYPQEVEKELFWIDRLTYPGEWPHTGHGEAPAPVPGLRYEVWYFQKRETVLLALLCEAHLVLEPLTDALGPVFRAIVEEGRYARRYRPVTDRSPEATLILAVAPNSRGIWRSAPLAEEKLVKALETLIVDTYPPVHKALRAADLDGQLPEAFRRAVGERDPLSELQARFNTARKR